MFFHWKIIYINVFLLKIKWSVFKLDCLTPKIQIMLMILVVKIHYFGFE
jgi:hypothetical protein